MPQQIIEDMYDKLYQEKEDYKSRCEKAIEYIKFEWVKIVEDECYENHLWSVDGLVIKKLLNILQNGSEEK